VQNNHIIYMCARFFPLRNSAIKCCYEVRYDIRVRHTVDETITSFHGLGRRYISNSRRLGVLYRGWFVNDVPCDVHSPLSD